LRSRLPAGSESIQNSLGIIFGLIVLIAFAVLLSIAIQSMRGRSARLRRSEADRSGEAPTQQMPWKG